MSRIEELKKQNPNFGINYVDYIHMVIGKSKYTELMLNLFKNKLNEKTSESDRHSLAMEIVERYGLDFEFIMNTDYLTMLNLWRVLDEVGYQNFNSFKKFMELNEKKLIGNSDLTSYKTFDELNLQISLSSLRQEDNELEKQVVRLYDTDEWLVLKPLTYQSSLKYGAATKWCTASHDNPDYFFRYVKRGVLVYCINKKTGNKVAAFKNIDTSYESETSFWDVKDIRIDSMDTDLPFNIIELIRVEFKNKKTNWETLSDEHRLKQTLYLETLKNEKKSYYDELTPVVGNTGEYFSEEISENEAEEVHTARVIPMGVLPRMNRTYTENNGPTWSEPTTTA